MRRSPLSRSIRSLLILVLASIVAFSGVQQSRAASVTFNFTGTVTQVDPILAGTFNTTQTLSGSYTFDSLLVGGCAPNSCTYNFGTDALAFSIGSYNGGKTGPAAGGDVLLEVNDQSDLRTQFSDVYRADWISPVGPDVVTPKGSTISSTFGFTMSVTALPAPSALTSTDLLLVPPVLSDFTTANWSLIFVVPDPTDQRPGNLTVMTVAGTLDSLTLASVPEPSTGVLGITALIGIGGALWRRSRSRQPE